MSTARVFQPYFPIASMIAVALVSSAIAQVPDRNQALSVAESQYQIVVIQIKQKRFDKAMEEANKIFQMKWPPDEEPRLLKSLQLLSSEFLHSGKPDFSVRLLDSNIGAFKDPKSKAAIMKDKGYLLEKMGEPERAIECFREAMRLESGSSKSVKKHN